MIDWTVLRKQFVGEYDAQSLPPKIEIPMMPTALIEFLQKADNPEVTAKELAKCIERDQGLTCELLKYVNSSAIGIRHKASTPQRAITVLGAHRSKLVLMTTAVQKSFKPRKVSGFDYDGFTASNLERGLFAKHFAEALNTDADLAFAGGMLVDCLLPKLFTEMPKFYPAYAAANPGSKPNLPEFEQKVLGWTHASAAAQIMLGWSFPDDLICCVALHHQTHKVLTDAALRTSPVAAVALAALAPDTPLLQIPGGLGVLHQLNKLVPRLDGVTVAIHVAEELQTMAVPMGQHVPTAQRMQIALAQFS